MSLIIFILLTLGVLFLPGFALFKKINFLKIDSHRLVASPVVGIFGLSCLELIKYFGFISSILITAAVAIVLLLSIYYIFKTRKKIIFDKDIIQTFCVFFGLMVALAAYITLPMQLSRTIVPDPYYIPKSNYASLNTKILNISNTPANDNFLPYRQAQFFVNKISIKENPFLQKEWAVTFFFRTPLMGIFTAGVFDATNTKVPIDYPWRTFNDIDHSYAKFQLLAHALNLLLFLIGYLVVKKIFNNRVALIAVYLAGVNFFFFYNSFFSWPKSFVAYFILLALYAILEYRKFIWAGILIGIAYLAHDLAVIYFIGLFYLVFMQKEERLKNILKLVFGSLVFALPWLFISKVVYKQTSLFFYYPFSLNGMPNEKDNVLKDFLEVSPAKFINIKLQSLQFLTLPYQFIYERSAGIFNALWATSLFSLFGAVGISVYPLSIIEIIKKYKKYKRIIIAMIFIPIMISIFIVGWPKGLGILHFAEPTVFLLIGFGAALLLRLNRRLALAIVILLILQTLVNLFFGYNFSININNLYTFTKLTIIFLYFLVAFIFIKKEIFGDRSQR
jgi:hypothetical protein